MTEKRNNVYSHSFLLVWLCGLLELEKGQQKMGRCIVVVLCVGERGPFSS